MYADEENVEILAGTAVLLFFVMGAISTHIENRRRTNPEPEELPDWCKFVCPACKALAGQPCINGASCMERVLLEGLAEPPPELVWRHLVKRMFDECGSQKANDFIRRVETGEHDVPSPWSQLATPTLEAAATELPPICPNETERNATMEWDHSVVEAGPVSWFLQREKELRTAIQRLSQIEKERDEARLAVSLTCELHGCASKSCTAAQYHEDAQVMIRRVETAEAELAALQAKLGEAEKEGDGLADDLHAAWESGKRTQAKLDAILKLVEGGLPELSITREDRYKALLHPPKRSMGQEGVKVIYCADAVITNRERQYLELKAAIREAVK